MLLEPAYFLLLAAALAAFYLLPRDWRTRALVIASLAFYAYFGGLFLLILLAEVALVYWCSRRAQQDLPYAIGLGVPLAILAVSKYLYQALVPGFRFASLGENLILPLGISYLTFELLHYLIDTRAGRIQSHGFLDLLSFVLFFPSFAAGPIKRFNKFFRQPRAARFVPGNLLAGSVRIAIGLVKKLVIADALVGLSSILIDFRDPGTGLLWLGIFAFSLRIYFDFSAYSDIAIGSARLFGIAVPENFANPYLKGSVRGFWRSWHMTLCQWVMDYVYIPLGGSRRGPLIRIRNVLIVFALIGLWHGGTLSFLLWGLYNGGLVSADALLRPRLRGRSLLLRAAGIAGTFVLISFGWIFFVTNAALLPAVLLRALALG